MDPSDSLKHKRYAQMYVSTYKGLESLREIFDDHEDSYEADLISRRLPAAVRRPASGKCWSTLGTENCARTWR